MLARPCHLLQLCPAALRTLLRALNNVLLFVQALISLNDMYNKLAAAGRPAEHGEGRLLLWCPVHGHATGGKGLQHCMLVGQRLVGPTGWLAGGCHTLQRPSSGPTTC